MRLRILPVLTLTALSSCLFAGCSTSTSTASTTSTSTTRPQSSSTSKTTRPLTRLFFEDHSTQRLRWLDVLIDDSEQLTATAAADVAGFKTLDAERQRLVQMRESNGTIVVGIRDDDEGKMESGWILVASGVHHHDHGDHGHWSFKQSPSVIHARLDQSQGNPAHVYEYGDKFFVANDRLSGYTRLDPGLVAGKDSEATDPAPRFIEGGGNHITLAVVDDAVGYSCWIDGGGPNKGRGDVTPLTSNSTSKTAYSFALPSGGIHGAIANCGRVFLAPSDGICWVDADRQASLRADDVKVNYLSLGMSDEKPRRTGAFVNHEKYVLCVTGKGTDSHLALIDASADAPKAQLVSLNASSGTKVVTPMLVITASGDTLAMTFHDHEGEAAKDDVLQVINLDPDKNGDCSDATAVKVIKIGPSEVDGLTGITPSRSTPTDAWGS